MPTFVKVVLFGLFFCGFFLFWMATIQSGFGVKNLSLLTTNESRVAWGVPLVLMLLSPLAYIPFSKIIDRWCENQNN